MYLDFI